MSSSSTHTVPETITPTDRVRDSLSDPLEDPIKAKETQPLSPSTSPLSPDYTPASPDYTPNTPHSDEESEPIEAPKTRTASPSNSTSPLSLDHLLSQISPTFTPSRAFYYRSTARMVVHTQPILLPGISARVTEAMALSPPSFCKRYKSSFETPSSSPSPLPSPTLHIWKSYRGTSELILDTETEDDESEAEGAGLGSEESEDKGPNSEGEEAAAARRHALKLAEDPAPTTFEVGQSSRLVPDQLRANETPRIPTHPTWVDLEHDTIYLDIEIDPRSLTTQAATISVDEDEFKEVGAPLDLHGSILQDHTQRLDALPPILFEDMGQGQATITFGALWQLVLALEAWVGQTDAQRAALWQARYEDQREKHALRMQHDADQREMQGLRERVATLERMMDRLERDLERVDMGGIDMEVVDFEELIEEMVQAMTDRIRIDNIGADGQVVFASHAWRSLFGIRGSLVRESILEFSSTFRIAQGRGQAPEKVTTTDLYYLRSMEEETLNFPYLLAHYLFRLLGIPTWVALGLERQHVGTAAGAAQADQEVPEEGVQADPAPALAPQAPLHGCSHPQEYPIEAVEIRGGGSWIT
ncbi:hypothetical protein Tco_0850220 [Tanacetum coccineum]